MVAFVHRKELNQARRKRTKIVLQRKLLAFLLVFLLAASVYRITFSSTSAADINLVNSLSDPQLSQQDSVVTCSPQDCGAHGTCLVNRCICVDPKYTGERCDQPNPNHNARSIACFKGNDDRCMNIPKYGRLKTISKDRTEVSRKCEVSWWETSKGIPVRNEQQLVAFDGFQALPGDLGDVLELGAGPFTKIRLILEQQQRLVKSITLVDPLLDEYLSNTNITTSFDNKELCVKSDCIPVKLHSTTAEAFDVMPGSRRYDTVILVNTLEHTENAVQILHNIYALLKPGSILVFGEEFVTSFQLQIADPCHPIRIQRQLFDEYLELFPEKLLGPRTGMGLEGITHEGVKQSIYAIVRK